jgi:hypothetical protein
VKILFGVKCRPHRDRKDKAPRLQVVVETPAYDLTIFKLHFGKLTLKVYTKGERVLRFEAIVHNTKELRCGRLLVQFLNNLYCMDASFISGETLDQLATPSQVGKTRIGGRDVNKPRTRAVLSAVLALACSPDGFTTGQLANTVRSMLPATDFSYDPRRAAYDLRKLRGKELLHKVPDSRRYFIPQQAVRTIAALVILREKILRPILAGVGKPKMGRKPKNWSSIDEHYEAVRQDRFTLMEDLRIAA